jgi:signal transduction histidine kinase
VANLPRASRQTDPAARGPGIGDDALAGPTRETGDRDELLRRSLTALRDDLGFETASVFVRGPETWTLLVREGPVRSWHALLDPSALVGIEEAAEFPDVRAIPGSGERLAAMGCASLAVLPLPGGARLLLDASIAAAKGWVERARPYLSLIAVMAGPGWVTDSALQSHRESVLVDRVFDTCQQHVMAEGATEESLVDGVRTALGADEVYVLSEAEAAAGLDVVASPADLWPRTVPLALGSDPWPAGGPALDESALSRIAVAVRASSPALAAAVGAEGDRREIVVAGWSEGPALSGPSMTVVARAVSTARQALRGRGRAVSARLDRERAEMAYALHDGVLQTVTGAVLELEGLRARIEQDPAEAISTLEEAKGQIRGALAELRAMLFRLARGDGRTARTPSITRQVQDLVQRWRLPVRVRVEGDLGPVPDRVLSVGYIVIREAVANAAKHSAGSSITVMLRMQAAELLVSVADTGPGFTPRDEAAARGEHHMGLQMLRARVADIGGKLLIESQPGRGTRVVARLPIPEEAS